jgi:hypothetical protein
MRGIIAAKRGCGQASLGRVNDNRNWSAGALACVSIISYAAGGGLRSISVSAQDHHCKANWLGISVAKGGRRMVSVQLVSRSLLEPVEINFWKMP